MGLPSTKFKINWTEATYSNNDAQTLPFFTWLGKTIENEVMQLGQWTSCRELMTLRIHEDIVSEIGDICTDHIRLALKYNQFKTASHHGLAKIGDEPLETAIRVLNLIEEKAGWCPTIITKSENSKTKSKTVVSNVYVVIGPQGWIRSPSLVSLYLLIIRSSWFRPFSDIKKVEDIIPVCKEMSKTKCGNSTMAWHIKYLSDSYKYWLLLVLNKDHLFKKRSPRAIYKGSHIYAGIDKLIALSSEVDRTTRSRWKKLVSKEHIE